MGTGESRGGVSNARSASCLAGSVHPCTRADAAQHLGARAAGESVGVRVCSVGGQTVGGCVGPGGGSVPHPEIPRQFHRHHFEEAVEG